MSVIDAFPVRLAAVLARLKRPLLASLAVLACLQPAAAAAAPCLRGINLAGAEFGDEGSEYGRDYIYPSEETISHFAELGFTSVRLPFKWERLQPALNAPFDETELGRLRETVETIRKHGMGVVLDPHNYARYHGEIVGTESVPDEAFAAFWADLAAIFANDQGVSYGLMNEPYDVAASRWLESANAAIAAIRAAGADNLVLVPGTAWTGAHSWRSDDYGGANATAMAGVKDPAGNFAYEVHQYLDSDFSGTKGTCERGADAIAALEDFTLWLRERGARGYLGEFGAPADPECVKGLSGMVKVLEDNRDVWTGWAYWAAGDWWPPEEELNIQPRDGKDRPQLEALMPALEDRSETALACPSLER
ncbi:glycoside hydrolase family 5 protein [Rhizobiaceae bacterium BDR2-2]|uniref:Glycoside hydrolase family 5 protein n=1 Tax=Ectorhizobium quercum TaxID=2965071 RepID=A0AAE3N473_9HYPH|nr:glycoside hydrolase family 5 protein [Ectorhizobium quercum]MCX8999631.1 glycoside hydrolase family 5 protein [Ectorhizobium quercum]